MRTLQIELDEQTYRALTKWARRHNQSIEGVVQEAIDQVVQSQDVDPSSPLEEDWEEKIRREAKAWRALPSPERARYRGQFVAVHEGKVIGHDPDRRTLYLRVRNQLGGVPVLITPANAPSPREYRSLSPRIVHE